MSALTIQRVEQNDQSLVHLLIFRPRPLQERLLMARTLPGQGDGGDDYYWPNTNGDFARLGNAIATNTHLKRISFDTDFFDTNLVEVDITKHDRDSFLNGLRCNISINKLLLNRCDRGIGREVLNDFVPSNNNLSEVILWRCWLDTESANSFTSAIAQCENMEYIELYQCIIDDNSLRLLFLGIGGIGSLTQLRLVRNEISSVVHQALAALLEDTNCNLRELVLVIQTSWATDECVKSLARSLRYNKKLKVLKFVQGRTISEVGVKALSDVLCDTSSVNATYLSNHALHFVTVTHPYRLETPILPELLAMNHVEDWKTSAVKKILHTHPHFNVEPFFEWDLSLLPHVFQWFASVQDLARTESNISEANINTRKLDAIYQFARAMPLKFVPVPKVTSGKRNAEGVQVKYKEMRN